MSLTLISTPLDITTSDTAVATVSITSGITSTYDSYEFHFVNIHGATDDKSFMFQVDTGSDTDYDQPMTTTFWQTFLHESSGDTGLAYSSGNDQATTGDGNGVFQKLAKDQGADADQVGCGVLTLFDPSNTTFHKHFASYSNNSQASDYTQSAHVAGYIHTTAAITRIQFKFDAGDIQSGTIKMFGVK